MNPKRISIAIAMLVLLAGQSETGASLGEAGSIVPGEVVATEPPLQTTGILTGLGNKEIAVNGTSSFSGATIVSGAIIETPSGVSATVTIVNSGSLEVEPNTKLKMEFDQSAVKVLVTEGCATLRTKEGTTGEIISAGGNAKTDSTQAGKLEICPRPNAAATGTPEDRGLFHLGIMAALAIIVRGETVVAVPVAPRGVLY